MDKDVFAAFVTAIVLVCVTTVLPLGIIYLKRNERMELGMESMSAEIERIGEGQRFATKLLQTSGERAERLPRY